MHTSLELAGLLRKGVKDGGISIVPMSAAEIDSIEKSGAAAIDLRLGRWFAVLRQVRVDGIKVMSDDQPHDGLSKSYFRPFGEGFVIHPGRFVLAITLEWLSLPPSIGAYVTGKSSLGRRGLIIETAAGIHPGFSGCLALEIANVGEVPITINPGMKIAQMFPHAAAGTPHQSQSGFNGQRKPILGQIGKDPIYQKLKPAK
jgi:dCTP deaminase